MDDKQKQEVLEKAKIWWKESIVVNHIAATEKLIDPDEFNINPFAVVHLANFLTGNSEPESIAKALLYPRVLGTSFVTIFGSGVQKFTNDVLPAFGSLVTGLDIEFISGIDGRKKYCQLKSGPNTINKDDVATIAGHFTDIRNLSRQNHLAIPVEDLIVGVVYGEKDELSTHYKNITKNHYHPVLIGQEFWHHLTGDEQFYYDLIQSIGEVAGDADFKEELDAIVTKLSESDTVKMLSSTD